MILRGKTWIQIPKEKYDILLNSSETNFRIAFFKDLYYGEITYFKQLQSSNNVTVAAPAGDPQLRKPIKDRVYKMDGEN